MSPATSSPLAAAPSPAWDDRDLVRACLEGSEAAWTALIDKYARLIYSVPLKFRFSRADADDVFQAVCVDLLEQLVNVREPAALRGWLVRVATHKCLHARRKLGREDLTDPTVLGAELPGSERSPELIMEEVQHEQVVRDALRRLSDRCRHLLVMLFYQAPQKPYDEVARLLGVSRGSVSFLRGRCLHRLRQAMKAVF